jgi:hypothetical protein
VSIAYWANHANVSNMLKVVQITTVYFMFKAGGVHKVFMTHVIEKSFMVYWMLGVLHDIR